MAVIWQKNVKGVDYQVRSAGATRRLYTDGVYHSQFNPRQPVGGSVWDLLMLPAFFHTPGQLKRVLVLGVGGGAVIRQLDHFLALEQVVGVELNPVHLNVAKRFFGVKGRHIELIQADAIEWLKRYRGPKFDLIIDDLFGEVDGEPERVVEADASWFKVLSRPLAKDGTLVINFDTPAGLKTSAWFTDKITHQYFTQAYQFTTPLYHNCIGAFTQQATSRRQFEEHLGSYPEMDRRRKNCRINAHWRKLTL